MPGVQITVCESIRQAGNDLPILLLSARTLPEDLGPLDLLLPPPFYAVVPLPRTMPFDDNELPFRNFGP